MHLPLVLLSGLLSDEALWRHQAVHLSDIAPIQMISSSGSTPQEMVEAILKQAPPQFALAGHSMGGWLCLEVMRAAPSRVMKLCLLNTTSRIDSEEKRRRREKMIQQTEQGDFLKVVKEIVEHFVFNSHVKLDVEKMFLKVGEAIFVRQEKAMMMRSESTSVLPTIGCPTLVIHALQDKVFSLQEHQELVDLIPHAKLASVENAGHMSPMERPQAITALLRFWLMDMN